MRRIFQAVPILCTVLLFGLGAFLPRLSALIFDQRLESDTMLLENQSFSFALEQDADFFQTLELFDRARSEVELSGGYRMNAEDAATAAVEVRRQLSAFDMAYVSPEVTPMLLTSKSTPGLSGVFWRCAWREAIDVPDGLATSVAITEVLWIDDQSGQMVSFAAKVGQPTVVPDPNALFPQTAVNVAEYCRLYYPVETVKLDFADEINPDSGYTLTLLKNQNGQETANFIPMRIVDGWLYFNT